MVICSVMGDSGTKSLGRASQLFRTGNPKATIFRDTPYIRALNRLLSQESLAVHTYQRVALYRPLPKKFAKVSESHQKAAREIVRLITLHSGLPEDKSRTSMNPPDVILRFLSAMTPNLGQKSALKTLGLVERRIVRHYARAIRLAPESDRAILMELQKKAVSYRDSLKKIT